MRKKVVFAFLGLLTVAMMLAVSCSPAATTTAPATSAQPTTTAATKTSVPPTTAASRPKYGGTLTVINPANITIFGTAVSNRVGGTPGMWEQITTLDRTVSLANGGTVDYGDGATSMKDVIGQLAEKWSTPDANTWILDIRKGVRFAKAAAGMPGSDLVNGREMTADDIIASIEYIRDTPSEWASAAEPVLYKALTCEKTGPWQVTIHIPKNPSTAYLWVMGGGGCGFIHPKEWLPKYGTNNDWKVQVGTGPYYMTDWVDNSVLTLVRNNNYWDTNPCGPGKGDKLPYADGVKMLIIPDFSTQVAAFRTSKADMYAGFGSITREDWNSLKKTNPQMSNYKFLNLPLQVGFRRDKIDRYKDIRVRKALMMATDMVAMKDGLFGGEAEILDSPARKLYPTCYTPLEQLPKETQELYTYNPEKAKALLKEAGYPNGFSAKMMIDSSTTASDMAQTLKAQWIKVGVDIEIQIKEGAIYMQLWTQRNYEDMILTRNAGGNNALFVRYSFGYFRGTNSYNVSYVNDPPGSDPTIEKYYEDEVRATNTDFAAMDKAHKDANVYILGQAFLIPTPADYVNRVWQPWIKDYYGESAGKWWMQYVWIDQDLKAKMTGR